MNVWGENIPDVEKRGLFRAVVKGMDSLMEKLRSERGDTMAEGVEAEVSAADKNIRDVEDRKQTYLLLILDTYKDEVRLFHGVQCAAFYCGVCSTMKGGHFCTGQLHKSTNHIMCSPLLL
jgi:hypothetical protein